MCSENVFCEESEQKLARLELTHQKTSMSKGLDKVETTKLGASPHFNVYPIRYKQEFLTVEKNQIQFFSISPIQMISLATSLIPFLEHDDANRALMGSNMQRQAVPVIFAEKPLVGTGLELQAARDSSTVVLAKQTGQIIYVDSEQIIVESSLSRIDNLKPKPLSAEKWAASLPVQHELYKLQNYWRSNQNTCLRQRAQVKQGEWVEKGDLLADGSATEQGEIALGKNILLAYMPWEGYNFEDAIVINERLVQEDIYTSIHIDRYDIEIRETSYGKEKITRDLPYINSEQTRNLDTQGIIFPGTWVEEGDILVGKVTPISPPKPTPEYRLLLAIFETKPIPFKETSLRIPQGVEGRVLDCIIDYQVNESSVGVTNNIQIVSNQRNLLVPQKVQIFLAHKRKIQLGDKMSGRHGNKGIVSLILPPQDMPFLQDGTPVDIVLNPLGVPSRMNVGQVLECLFGLAGHYLQEHYRLLPFDEMYGKNASRGLVYKKLYEASCRTGQNWIFDPNNPGKSHLFDGRTGELFHQPILIGYSYMFKLIHLVDEKMHARSTGPYSLVTQQPLGGRSKHGGQRLGEMEVWALEGFGAASILQEFLTVKSDEIYARNTFLFHLMKRRKLPRPGLPESFRVLVHELQSLCMSVYYNPDFRLTYPSLIGWDGLFLLSSKKFPTLQQLSNLKNI
jgi:DNA-directed RNA polymerase subunit beta